MDVDCCSKLKNLHVLEYCVLVIPKTSKSFIKTPTAVVVTWHGYQFHELYIFDTSCYVNILIRIFDHNVSCLGRWGCMVGCMGRIFHINLKIRMGISRIATSKNYIELVVPGQI